MQDGYHNRPCGATFVKQLSRDKPKNNNNLRIHPEYNEYHLLVSNIWLASGICVHEREDKEGEGTRERVFILSDGRA